MLLLPHRRPHHSLEIPGQARPHYWDTVTIPGGRLGYRGAGFYCHCREVCFGTPAWGLLFEGLCMYVGRDEKDTLLQYRVVLFFFLVPPSNPELWKQND